MYNWTDEQLEAINASGSPIIVSAAAGSGKTAVLVERTIRLLCDPEKKIPADRLLAVTFTNDAASQMRQKLSREIDLRAELEPENAWIMRQQALLRLAEITTINSFCLNLVKDNISATDFQSGIRIIEENEAAMLTDRALTAVLEREYSEDPDGMEELISLFCRENDASLRRLILQLHTFLRTLPFSEIWAKNATDSLRGGAAAAAISEDIKSAADERADMIRNAVKRLRTLAGSLEFHSSQKAAFLENCTLAEAVLDSIKNSTRSEIFSAASAVQWKNVSGARKKAEKEAETEAEARIYAAARDCFNGIKERFKDLAALTSPSDADIASDGEKCAKYFEKLCVLCEKLEAETHAMKVERNAVDFADTELMSVRLLASCDENGVITRTPLAEEIAASGRYRVILIDEFQDVNDLQEVIFRAVSDSEDMRSIGKNVFAVGDVKQAIYRFRRANPKIFMRTREQGRSTDFDVRELLLRKNFRSRQSVLGFCNYVFGALMSIRLGETDYTSDEALVLGADYSGGDPPTEIIVIDGEDEEDVSAAEFSAAAKKIREMLDLGVTVSDGGETRPCRPSDFCILTRNNIQASDVSGIFSAQGLKLLTNDTSGYLKSREISVLINLLAVITDPMQDIRLASVMLSPIMGFSDDDIAALRLINRDEKLYKTVLSVSLGEYPADGTLREKCAAAVSMLKRLGIMASGLSLTRLIRKIYDTTDIFAMAASYEDGERKCANLNLLLEYARAYEQSSHEGAAGFLRYIDYISKSGGDFEQALTVTESSDAVVMKTVHRSKGLEYPFVFLCQTGKRFNLTDLNGALQLNPDRGVGLSFYDYSTLTKRPTVFWESVRRANRSELLSEELRLLYVAMTRAREQLFIVLDIGEKAIKRAKELSYEVTGYKISPAVAEKALCSADWLILALFKHPGFNALRSRLGYEPYADGPDCPGGLPEIAVSFPAEGAAPKEDKAEVYDADPALSSILRESFLMSPDSRLTENEAKLTVSEIVKDDALSFFPRVPSLDGSLEELSAAQRGTITHRFMQYCDFDAADRDLEWEISRLEAANIFTPKEAAAISRRGVAGFFKSGIYSRLRKSGSVLRERQFIVRFDDIDLPGGLAEIYRGTDGMLQGIADCLFEEEGGYVLVDYKTDRVKTADELLDKYSAQLVLYKAAFDALLSKPVKSCFIYSFHLGEGIEIKI